MTWIFSDALPFGGAGWSVDAYSTFAALTGLPSASICDAAGFLMSSSRTNVNTVRKIRIAAAPTVQPISSCVLPWICAATAPLRARYLIIE